jgi:uncharacterized membrane protein YuzA (DUF378 family)
VVRPYARYVGIGLVVLGLIGLVLSAVRSEEPLFGLLNIGPVESTFRLLTGALMVYVGFRVASESAARAVVGVLGALYLLVALLGFVTSDLFDTLPSDFTEVDNVIHLLVGVLGIVAASPLGRRPIAAT